MTIARAHLVNEAAGGFYHVMSRCVRRAFLCGRDRYSGKDFSHRKVWLEQRILALSQLFAVEVWAYAVMSNHYHIVLRLDPARVKDWPDEDIARRWLALCPPAGADEDAISETAVERLAANPDRIAVLRPRLGSLSWFMRFLNEPLARRANREDACRGRFWEGRFKSQALLDEAAVLTCMAYVDLNPIRAKVCQRLEDSPHTSIRTRIKQVSRAGQRGADALALTPLGLDQRRSQGKRIPLVQYLDLVDWTGRVIRTDKRGAILQDAPPLLARLGLEEALWVKHVAHYGRFYYRAFGHIERLKELTKALHQSWLKGQTAAAAIYK